MTVLGIDFGLQRIGLAFSDPGETIAFAGLVIAAADEAAAAQRIAQEAGSRKAGEIVVGLPTHMDGTASEMSARAAGFAEKLRLATPARVVLWDERLTSLQAERAMRGADLSRRKRKNRIDPLAAQLMLQSYLDAKGRKGKDKVDS